MFPSHLRKTVHFQTSKIDDTGCSSAPIYLYTGYPPLIDVAYLDAAAVVAAREGQ